MRKIYLKSLKNAVNNFYFNISTNNLFKIDEIHHLLTFVGLSKIEEYENSNIENSCSLFPNLKKLTLFCTNDSSENATTLKNKLYTKNLEIQIFTVDREISNTNFYFKILNTICNENFESIFFDTTQGMKNVSITFYKLGVELGIKSLNWVTTHFVKNNSSLIRCIDNLRVDFLSNPKNENYQFFKLINQSIDNFDFLLTSNLYKSINDNQKADFFRSLSSLFNESYIDINFFKDKINTFAFKFFKLSSFSQKKFYESFNILNFFSNNTESDVSIVKFDLLSEFGFDDNVTEDEIEYLYNYLFIPFILNKFKNKDIRKFIFSNYLSLCFNNQKIDYFSDDFNYYFKILNNFFATRQVEVFTKQFIFSKLLKENIFSIVNFSIEKIKIEGYEININNIFINKFFGLDLKSLVLKKLIQNKNQELFIKDILKLIEDLNIKNISKAFSDLEKNFSLLNTELNNIFIKENLEYRDIIKYIPNKETRFNKSKKDTINNNYIYPKIFINIYK